MFEKKEKGGERKERYLRGEEENRVKRDGPGGGGERGDSKENVGLKKDG